MQKILVTGSSGKLGKEIVNLLKTLKYDVTGIDIIKSDTTDELIDIREKNRIKKIVKGQDAIIHTAALHGKHTDLGYSRDKFIETNIKGTNNLLSLSKENGIKKFIYTSTTSIYGWAMVCNTQATWVDETLAPIPRDIYDITKLSCELLCKDYFEKEGIETSVLRVSRFMNEDKNTKANHRLYRGLDERDGAEGHRLVLESKFEKFEIFNISNDSPFKKEDLKDLYKNPKHVICKYHPEAVKFYEKNNWKFPDKIDRVYSIDKAKLELGFKPINNFKSFLK